MRTLSRHPGADRARRLSILLLAACATLALATACDDGGDDPPMDTSTADTAVDTTPDTDVDPGDTAETTTDTGDDTTDVDPTDADADTTPDTDTTTTDADVDTTDTEEVVECDPVCGDNQVCNAGVCECSGPWGDCDGMAANGCEEPLDSPEHCGTCDPGNNCDLFGLTGVCVANTPGQTGFCPVECAPGYYDLDEDLAGGSPVTGCELGLVEAYATDLSASLPGTVLDAALDGDTLVVAVDDTSLKLIPIDVSGDTPMAGTATPGLLGPSSRTNVAFSNGIVAATTADLVINVFELVAGELVAVSGLNIAVGVADVAMLPSPVLTESVAEFVAVGNGITWYAVVPKGMEFAMGCTTGAAGSNVSVCEIASDTNPSNAAVVATGLFMSEPWAVIAGATSREATFDATPQLSPAAAGGDDVPTTLADAMIGPGDSLHTLEANALVEYAYTFNGGNPSSRARSEVATLSGTGTHLTLVDDARVAAGTDAGLDIVQLSDGKSIAVTGIASVDALAGDATRLFVVDGTELVRLDYDFYAP